MIKSIAIRCVVFLSLFIKVCAVSPLNYVCKNFNRTLYEGKFAIAEIPVNSVMLKSSKEKLEYFVYERNDTYAMELLEKWNILSNAYSECPTYTVFQGESYSGYCDEAKSVIYNLTFDGKPVLLALDPLCLHSESFRPQTLQRFHEIFPRNNMVERALTEMKARYGLFGDVKANAKLLKENLDVVANVPPITSWMTYWSILDQRGKLLESLPLRERLTYNKYSTLYKKYAGDLQRVRATAKVWLNNILQLGCTGQYDDIEAEIQYIRLRELQPKRTLEMSCRCGWSTFWLLSALHDNYHYTTHSGTEAAPELWSYDIVPDVLSLPMPENLKQFWKFTVGDARETLMKINVDGEPPQFDYLFIDSDHSQTFARDYTDYLLESQKGQFLSGSIHDVYPHRGTGEWGPSPEGIVVLEWLAFMPGIQSSHVFTVSAGSAHGLHYALLKLRRDLGIAPLGVLDDLVRHQGHPINKKFQLDVERGGGNHDIAPSPTLFFDIERSSEMIEMLL